MKHFDRILGLAAASQEPTIASIPFILLRGGMRTLARIVLLAAALTLSITVLLGSLAVWLATWPSIHRGIGRR